MYNCAFNTHTYVLLRIGRRRLGRAWALSRRCEGATSGSLNFVPLASGIALALQWEFRAKKSVRGSDAAWRISMRRLIIFLYLLVSSRCSPAVVFYGHAAYGLILPGYTHTAAHLHGGCSAVCYWVLGRSVIETVPSHCSEKSHSDRSEVYWSGQKYSGGNFLVRF